MVGSKDPMAGVHPFKLGMVVYATLEEANAKRHAAEAMYPSFSGKLEIVYRATGEPVPWCSSCGDQYPEGYEHAEGGDD